MKLKYLPLLLILFSCTKDEPIHINKPGTTLFAAIGARKELSLYQAALKRAGMFNTATFSDGGPFTVFAPVDSAFINAGLTLDSINKYDSASLSLVLKYSIIYGNISSATLVGFYAQNMICQHPTYRPRINKNYYGIFFDGIPVIAGNSINPGDGILHELNRLPLPPTGNLFEMLSQQPDLTLFMAVVKRTGYDTKLMTTANGYTIFAPTNDAYKKVGLGDVDAINNADISMLSTPMENLVYQRIFYTADFMGGYSFSYDLFYVNVDGFTITTAGNVDPTHIIRPDIIATNGTIQVVDQLFFVR